MEPLVAVAIATYNQEKYIIECLASVVAQSYKNIKVFISDDCSSDNSVQKIREYIEKEKLEDKVFVNPSRSNLGIARNFQRAVDMSLEDENVEYVIPFAGDDLMLVEKVAKQVAALRRNTDKSVCFSNMEWFDSKTNKKIIDHFNFILRPSCNLDAIISDALVPTPSLCFTRSIVEKVSYREQFKYISDYVMLVEAAFHGGIIYIDEPLVRYRKHGESIMDTVLFLDERVEASRYLRKVIGHNDATERFEITADYDYLLDYYQKSEYRKFLRMLFKLFPTFFSSRKWLIRFIKLIKFVMIR